MMTAPARKRREVPRTVRGGVIGEASGAARRVEKMQGKKR
jgi:hypothetical protein